jgi:predicted Zn-dependent protease
MNAREIFENVAYEAKAALQEGEAFSLWFAAEQSSFVRMNAGKVRQPTDLLQLAARLDLRRGRRHAAGETTLTGVPDEDRARVRALAEDLRAAVAHVPEDPYLMVADPASTERADPNQLPEAPAVVDALLDEAEGLDLVGVYAAGGVFRGYACDQGSRSWFESYPFHLDFSVFLEADKATKQDLAGFSFDKAALAARVANARRDLEVLARPSRTLDPGGYRAFLTPTAMAEVLDLLGWGFGRQALETKTTPLLALALGETSFDERVSLVENTAEGAGPGFMSSGFLKPDRVDLVKEGAFAGTLTSPRSAEEYGVPHNGAENHEGPAALEMSAGELATGDVLAALDEGLYVSNLWYTNFSDKKSCRVTGMTRFATMWVEGGEVVAPVNVMRFDDSLYRVLGEQLEAITKERELLLDAGTYFKRSTECARLPGALVKRFELTL